jgi:hydrogenase maturation protease
MGAARPIPNEYSSKPAADGKPPEVLVLGLGNTRLTDDGVGVWVVRHLAHNPETPPGLLALDAGAFGFRFLSKLKRAQAVLIVDVAEIGAPAGATCLLEREALAMHMERGGRISAHNSGLAELLDLVRLKGYRPKRFALLAVQPDSVDWGEDLSGPVSESLPTVCEQVVRTVLAWQQAPQAVPSHQSLDGSSGD